MLCDYLYGSKAYNVVMAMDIKTWLSVALSWSLCIFFDTMLTPMYCDWQQCCSHRHATQRGWLCQLRLRYFCLSINRLALRPCMRQWGAAGPWWIHTVTCLLRTDTYSYVLADLEWRAGGHWHELTQYWSSHVWLVAACLIASNFAAGISSITAFRP